MLKRLSLISVLILTLGLIPVFIYFGSGLKLIDFITQQIPFIIETKRMFASGAPWWSWNTYYGDNFIGCYSFYSITSPFVWIACLFPYDKILWGILLALCLKIICTSIFSYLYFKRMKFDNRISCLGAILYTFSSFYVCNLFYYHFCEPVMLFPLLLISLENVIEKRGRCYFWLSIISFLTIFINFYFAASSFIIGFIYYVLRAHSLGTLNISNVVKTLTTQFVGILLSSFILLPTLLHIFGGPRATVSTNLIVHLGFESINGFLIRYTDLALRLFLPMTSETPDTFFTSGFSSTQGFITLFGWLFAIVYCLKKRDWLFWLLLILSICYFTPFGGIFTLFTSTTCTRWIYAYVLMGILASMYVIRDNYRINKKSLVLYIVSVAAIIVLYCIIRLISSRSSGMTFSLNKIESIDILLWIINIVSLVCYLKKPTINNAIQLAILCCTLNLIAFTYNYFNSTGIPEISTYIENQSQNRSDSDFEYRTDFETRYRNLPILLNRPGVISFHSVYNKQLKSFREIITSNSPKNSVYITKNREAVAALMSVKEVYYSGSRIQEIDTYDFGLSYRGTKDNFTIFDYKYYIPMGFAYDSYVSEAELQNKISSDSIDVANVMLKSIVIKNSDIEALSPYLKHAEIDDNISFDEACNARRIYTVSDFVGNTKGYSAKSNFDKDKVIFFSVAADPGFKATIDGQQTKIYNVNLGMSAIIVPAGHHTILFNYIPSGFYLGCIISACSMIILIILYFRPRPELTNIVERGLRLKE